MANKIILKKSAVSGKAPLVADLDYGELAVNYADGKLYYKNSSNSIDSIPSANATATLTNKTLSAATLSGTTNVTGEFVVSNALGAGAGDEGGEVKLATPTTNTTLAAGTVSIDVYQNKVRIFETGGTNRGVYIDLTTAQTAAGSNLMTGGGGGGTVTVIGRSANINVVAANNVLPVYARSGTVNVSI